jgi:arylsulfatase A-like enzyme
VVSQGYFTYWYLTGGPDDSAETIVQRAIHALDEHGTDDIFLWLHFINVHRPYTLPPGRRWTDIWHTARITRPEYKHPSERDERYISETYDSAIRYVDGQLERLHAYLSEQGGEDPLFVVTADHGEEFGEHGDWFHREFKMYNELLKVPLLMHYPSGEGRHVDGLTSLVDVAPTLLEYADIDVPAFMAGESLLSVVQTGTEPTREVVISEVYDPERDTIAITTKNWKYIHDRTNGVRHLYNLDSDPDERNDLLPKSTVPDELRQHEQWYTERMERSVGQEMDEGVQTRLRELGYLE